jgi:hypothetical protein
MLTRSFAAALARWRRTRLCVQTQCASTAAAVAFCRAPPGPPCQDRCHSAPWRRRVRACRSAGLVPAASRAARAVRFLSVWPASCSTGEASSAPSLHLLHPYPQYPSLCDSFPQRPSLTPLYHVRDLFRMELCRNESSPAEIRGGCAPRHRTERRHWDAPALTRLRRARPVQRRARPVCDARLRRARPVQRRAGPSATTEQRSEAPSTGAAGPAYAPRRPRDTSRQWPARFESSGITGPRLRPRIQVTGIPGTQGGAELAAGLDLRFDQLTLHPLFGPNTTATFRSSTS